MTTQQLARLWRVSEATIKRWADAGLLRASRTLGGHRRFPLEEVARFQKERDLGRVSERSLRAPQEVKPAPRLTRKERAEALRRFYEAIVAAYEGQATALLLEAHLQGVPLVRILDETVTGAMRRIGDEWHSGELSVADEHLATRTAMRALEMLSSMVRGMTAGGQTALCCAVEEELHELPVLCAQILLEGEGWSVRNFGANTPFFALAEAARKHRPKLICVSSTMLLAMERNAREYMQLYEVANDCGAAIVLGGEGFRDEAVRRRFPAALHADNFTQLRAFLRSSAP